MVQLLCKLCLQSIQSESWKTHITLKEHIQELPQKIAVKGHFQNDEINNIYEYFTKFGGIRSQNVTQDDEKTTIEYRFWDARVYSQVIHCEHPFFKDDVEICWFKKGKTGPLECVVQDEKMQNEKYIYRKLAIINSTKQPPSFPSQLSTLLEKLKTEQNKFEETRQIVYSDLTKALLPNFPNNKLHFFGSSVTNLELPDSNVNMYLDSTDSSESTLELLMATITNSNFSSVTKDTSVKFKHKTGIHGEIHVKNELPVGTSELVKLYQSLDPKIKDLMLVLKFWADCHGLRHEGFSGYALSLMVIFYLQQEPYRLPTVWELQKDTVCDEVDGWNCAFAPVEFSNSTIEKATVLELLTGFFQFYGDFDYSSKVVSVFRDSGYEKVNFLEEEITVAGMCIQDPFEHSKNIISFLPLASSGKFTAACRKSHDLTHSSQLSKLLLFPQNHEFFIKIHRSEESFKTLLSKILTDVCSCDVTTISENVYRATGGLNIWDNRVGVSKKMSRSSEMSVVDYETAITSVVKNSAPNFSWWMVVTLRFENSRVCVQFQESEDLVFHIQHFIYVLLVETEKIKTEVDVSIKEEMCPVEVKEENNIQNEEFQHVGTLKTKLEDTPQVSIDVDAQDILINEEILPVQVKEEDSQDDEIIIVDPISNTESQHIETIDLDSEDNSDPENVTLDSLEQEQPDDNHKVNTQPVFQQDLPTTTQVNAAQIESILDLIKPEPKFTNQVLTLLEHLQIQPSETLSIQTTIKNDLTAILNTSSLKICFARRLSKLEHLCIFIDCDKSLEQIATLLHQSASFEHVVLTSQAITCNHLKTDVTCHVTLTWDQNNETIEKYANLKRVRSLMLIVKFWVDCHSLCSVGGVNTNTIYMFVIFFLQQPPYKVWCGLEVEIFETPLLELLRNFFKFFSSFDYIGDMICPCFGQVVKKKCFLQPCELPKGFEDFKNQQDLQFDSSLTVLDFAENFVSLGYDFSGKFTALCRYSEYTLSQTKDLVNILRKPETNILTLYSKNTKPTSTVIHEAERVFKNVFKCSITTSFDGINVTFTCIGSYNLWDKRISVLKKLSCLPRNDLSREVQIFDRVIEEFPKRSPWKTSIKFTFTKRETLVEFSEASGHLCHFMHIKLMKIIFGTTETTDNPNKTPLVFAENITNLCEKTSKSKVITDLEAALRNRKYHIYNTPLSEVYVYVQSDSIELQKLLVSTSKFSTILNGGPITCFHGETKVVLAVQDELALHRLALIEYYVSLDERIAKMITVVNIWAKRCHFSEIVTTMLVLLYLQQKCGVPSVSVLQKDVPAVVLSGWNCAFAKITPFLLLHEMTLMELFEGFFRFYGEFDCFLYAVAPFVGSPVAKTRFLLPFTVPEAYGTYTKHQKELSVDTGLCVQDFFEHSKNLAEGVSYDDACKFACFCRYYLQYFSNPDENLADRLLEFPPGYNLREFSLFSGNQDEESWVETVIDLFETLVEKVLKGGSELNQIARNYHYKCSGTGDVFFGRIAVLKAALKKLPRNASGLDKEIAVSTDMKVKGTTQWSWGIQFNFRNQPFGVKVLVQGSKAFVPCHFLYTRFLKYLTCKKICEKVSMKRKIDEEAGPSNKKRKVEVEESSGSRDNTSTMNTLVGTLQNARALLKQHKNQTSFEAGVFLLLRNTFADKERLDAVVSGIQQDLDLAVKGAFTFDLLPVGSAALDTFNWDSSFDICIHNLKKVKKSKVVFTDLLAQSGKFDVIENEPTVIKCRHRRYKITCSLHLRDLMPFHNTYLIKYYMSLDPKLRSLFCIIKSWFSFYSLRKVFSSYTLNLLVIFYLQHEPYHLPSVARLQTTSELVGGWNVAYTPIETDLQNLRNATLGELILGFFTFYANFDYYLYVIAPFWGSAIEKTKFYPSLDLPECYSLYTTRGTSISIDSSLCVQDPFVHDQNTAITTTLSCVNKFASLCMQAVHFANSSSQELLWNLLIKCKNSNVVENCGFLIPKEESWTTEMWIQKTTNVAVTVLTGIFCGTVDDVSKEQTEEQLEVSVLSRILPKIWYSRIQILKTLALHPDATDFDKDLSISAVINNTLNSKDYVVLNIQLIFNENAVKVLIKSKKQLHLKHFLYIKMLQGLRNETAIKPSEAPGTEAEVVAPPYKILATRESLTLQPTVGSLNEYFAKFEPASTTVLGDKKRFAVEYVFPVLPSYLRVIQEVHTVDGYKVKVVPLAPLNSRKPFGTFEDPMLSVIHKLIEPESFDRQAEILWKNCEALNGCLEKISSDLNRLLSPFFPGSKVFYNKAVGVQSSVCKVFITGVNKQDLWKIKYILEKDDTFTSVNFKNNLHIRAKHVEKNIECTLVRSVTKDYIKLLEYYMSLDVKFEKLLAVLTTWVRYYYLGGFSYKVISTLVVFFLQQEPFNLPPVYQLQSCTDSTTFKPVEFSNSLLKDTSLKKLLVGFFHFYANFDYMSYVISPFCGAAVLKTRFLKPYTLPKFFSEYMNHDRIFHLNSSINIQDFFNHEINVSSTIDLDNSGLFTALCRYSLDVFSEDNLFLYRLMLHSHSRLFSSPEFVLKKREHRDENEWMWRVKNITVEVLTKIMGCTLTQVLDFETTRVSIVGTVKKDIWKNRTKVAKKFEDLEPGMEKEIAITRATTTQKISPQDLHVRLEFERSQVKVTILLNNDSSVYHLCHFLYIQLMEYVEGNGDCCCFLPTLFNFVSSDAGANCAIQSDLDAKKNGGTTAEPSTSNEGEDDVPSDFFDDFSKDDFLDGLDIVNAWDNHQKAPPVVSTSSSAPKTATSRSQRSQSRRSSTSRSERKRSRSRSERRSRSRNGRSDERKRRRSRTRRRRASRSPKYRSRSRSPLLRKKESSTKAPDQEGKQKIQKLMDIILPVCDNVPLFNKSVQSVPVQPQASDVEPVKAPPLPVPPPQIFSLRDIQDPDKLFAQKKITLSQYLTLNAKQTDDLKMIEARKKAKVISRCQRVLHELKNGSQPLEKFVVQTLPKQYVKYQSPLKRESLRFPSIPPPVDLDEFLNTILRKTGVGGTIKSCVK